MDEARHWLRNARRIAVLTGAGISAESGIPTFRGAGGLWRQYRAEELATPQAFAANPKLVWEWYDWRRGLIAKARPNAGHAALVELENRAEQFVLITQNVDGLHARAGSRNVIYLHGDIWTMRCTRCALSLMNEQTPLEELPPRCACGGMLRPGVVWFGESLPDGALEAAEEAARTADVFLVIGTSAVVMPAGALALVAKSAGVKTIEINAESTAISARMDRTLRGPAGEILPQLVAHEEVK